MEALPGYHCHAYSITTSALFCVQGAGLGDSMNSSADASTIFAFTNKALDAVLSAVNQPLDALLQETKFVWQVHARPHPPYHAFCRPLHMHHMPM